MRIPVLATALALAALPASAQTISAEIGQTGLGATEARLAALPAPTDADRFALGGVRFLGAVERSLQIRWSAGLTDRIGMLPFLRLPMGDNPSPQGIAPDTISTLFREVASRMAAARDPLTAIPDTSDIRLAIDLGDLWFDINANTRRDPGEDLIDVAGPMFLGPDWTGRDPAAPAPVITFDAADAAWLAAYTHLLQGIAEVVLTYDPEPALRTVLDSRAAFAALSDAPPGPDELDAMAGPEIDAVSVVLRALNQTPDTARAASARENFLGMIAQNRIFWARVMAETDNDREWLPNEVQTDTLFGAPLPPGTRDRWLAVLGDAEAILKGERLIPFWRVGPSAGVNVARMFTDPRPIDVLGWAQGADALPYLERGPLASADNVAAFADMFAGQAMLMSLILN